ncbi:MAG: formylglycine-generating enzyme family protein [Candidatus Poribacteria bacterium]|nr:formylglycine-generating enzyme family protein [Candidatus Poribacteria bacterium]
MNRSHQVWLILLGFTVWWGIYGCADTPERARTPTHQTAAEPPQTDTETTPMTPLELGMAKIPGGEFLMGSETGEKDERPVHVVFLDAYEIDLYPATNEQYARFMQAKAHPAPPHWRDRKFNQPRQPVVDVSWFDAVAYCEWASKRLPTEAEWEKAARGSLVQKEYPWGDESPKERADFGQKHSAPLPVGGFPPNGYGLYDCAGGVWEWCSDWYEPDFYASSPRINPIGVETGGARVLRGGAWNNERRQLRVANRNWQRPKPNPPRSGFR